MNANPANEPTGLGGIDWSEYRVFLATVREGSLTAAGRALGLDASTVQRRLGKLEQALGVRLFERSSRGYVLTDAGEVLEARVRAMEEEARRAELALRGFDARPAGVVRVTTVDDLAVTLLPPIVQELRELHPEIAVELDVGVDRLNLTRGEADVALRLGQKPDEPDVVVKHVAKVHVAIYASRDYLTRHGRPERPEDLRAHAIVRGDARMARIEMERLIDQHGDPSSVVLRSGSMLTRLGAIRAGLGIGFLACFLGDADPGLERMPWRFPNAYGELWLAVHTDVRKSARVRAFVELAQARLTAQRARFEGVSDDAPPSKARRGAPKRTR